MHLSPLLLLSATLASAQYGPGPEELEYLKNINEGSNNNQNQDENYNHNYNGNAEYDGPYEHYQNTAASPYTPIQAPASSPSPLIHSTFVVRPSQAPVAQAQAPAPGYAYNHPSPDVSEPSAAHRDQQTPAPHREEASRSAPKDQSKSHGSSRHYGPSFDTANHKPPGGTTGNVAPVDPLKPGSKVAPPPLFPNKNYGKDEGNAFCMGECFKHESDAKCGEPYAMAIYKPAKGCYTCCFTSDF
ncbi:hypothetical protein N7471_000947 [Penicillium samsonianum]|uniref:uncharacterized protein n=1 Tax=Penicillium samsonianum TaxID=1882272 RepID=UPI002549202D|nr:uncharacterized protein N7471_000947 [Penicillium samsonianum]KAJ6149748.1 hypothetical protein N7471_000947 [Penicillium samsonianum]